MKYIIYKNEMLTLTTEETMSRKEKEKFNRVSHTYLHAKWNVQDFLDNLNFPCFGLDACRDIPLALVSFIEINEVWGKGNPRMARR